MYSFKPRCVVGWSRTVHPKFGWFHHNANGRGNERVIYGMVRSVSFIFVQIKVKHNPCITRSVEQDTSHEACNDS